MIESHCLQELALFQNGVVGVHSNSCSRAAVGTRWTPDVNSQWFAQSQAAPHSGMPSATDSALLIRGLNGSCLWLRRKRNRSLPCEPPNSLFAVFSVCILRPAEMELTFALATD